MNSMCLFQLKITIFEWSLSASRYNLLLLLFVSCLLWALHKKSVDGVVEMNVQFGNKINSVLSDLVF